MSDPVYTYLGLGSNLQEPLAQLNRALEELSRIPGSRLVNVSPFYRSKPVGPQDQPDFINAAACMETNLEAHALLDQLQAIEQLHGRQRKQHWGPRTLDLDILLYGNQTIDTQRLQVPHPYLTERNFVLVPLANIAPGLTLPGGQSLDRLVTQRDIDDLVALDPLGQSD
ncbi:2-amino-4-hydroxy-6-hydroxymethyldihydropteridine diphosphokinase [Gilvimarinus sp. SDUM040013]|uniref:2-amino-4-hydroxy-6-hydroxymethyldihydropteridine pyrophosphokinase n=1 Tax=Gilvimarinus gilvus TaxID=3058038 RepID=A0ABU4S1U8_9GAMM|nr:2-amino-4-hydroxy-6-hydroxymethyldihydropteridine diphosphokinase [Gilvimarinus sp. SDUM040013]MDO3386098.1 2-amino-4-hydroxy-6-hydroxymethyldihydropteridine diphosphokinase [Gilvimarinus sp. SDUM040013]MDX6850361.1 2-amino-4-hydroxy-6-hydroxymethyldihydropteridine diphosphokinase [Gilvimarinus sp. SDUM040013]